MGEEQACPSQNQNSFKHGRKIAFLVMVFGAAYLFLPDPIPRGFILLIVGVVSVTGLYLHEQRKLDLPTTASRKKAVDVVAAPMVTSIAPVWLMTEERMRDPLKMPRLDDHGIIHVFPGRLRFVGSKGTMDCATVERISMVMPKFPWLPFILGNAALLVVLFGGFTNIRADHPMTYGVLILLNCAFLVMVGPWIEVEYIDGDGARRHVYFSDGTSHGWGRLCGGTRRIYDQINAVVLEHDGIPLAESIDHAKDDPHGSAPDNDHATGIRPGS